MPFLNFLLLLTGSSGDILESFSEQRFQQIKPYILEVAASPWDAALLAGLAWTESDFIPTAVNASSGASGLMQIMPFHFSRFGWTGARSGEWQNPGANVRAGYIILREHGLGREPISSVLAGYGGFVTVDPEEYIRKVLLRATWLFPAFLEMRPGP